MIERALRASEAEVSTDVWESQRLTAKRFPISAQRFPTNEASHNPTPRFQYRGSHSEPRTPNLEHTTVLLREAVETLRSQGKKAGLLCPPSIV